MKYQLILKFYKKFGVNIFDKIFFTLTVRLVKLIVYKELKSKIIYLIISSSVKESSLVFK